MKKVLPKEKGAENSTPDPVKNQVKDNEKNGVINENDLDLDYNNHIKKPKNHKIKELLLQSEVDPFKTIETPPSILSIDNISYGTLGNFSCLSGKSKSKKTFFLSMLIARALDHDGKCQKIKTEISNTPILHFDTEQSRYHTQVVAKRIADMVDNKTNIINNYKCYCLRPYDPKIRINIIEEAIYNTNGLKLVVIDGIADLIIGYNNEDEAIKIIGKFMKWTHELNIHIITVIHQNKGDNNAKGHLGSLIFQKAETVLSVEKDGDTSRVSPSHSRGIDIQPLSFSIDENGLPYFVDYTVAPIANKIKKDPRDYEPEVHDTILADVFKNGIELSGGDFSRFLKDVLAKHSVFIGNTALRDWKTFYETSDLIYKENQQKPYKLRVS